MANIAKWNAARGITTVMSTEMFALANNTQATSASAYDNTANLDVYADIELFLPALSPSAGAYVAVYALEAVDGSNFPAPSAADLRLSATQLLATIPIGVAASTPQRVSVRNVLIPPFKFNLVVDNQTGVSLATSTTTFSTLKFNVYDYNVNG